MRPATQATQVQARRGAPAGGSSPSSCQCKGAGRVGGGQSDPHDARNGAQGQDTRAGAGGKNPGGGLTEAAAHTDAQSGEKATEGTVARRGEGQGHGGSPGDGKGESAAATSGGAGESAGRPERARRQQRDFAAKKKPPSWAEGGMINAVGGPKKLLPLYGWRGHRMEEQEQVGAEQV